jgi:hypothetical protein
MAKSPTFPLCVAHHPHEIYDTARRNRRRFRRRVKPHLRQRFCHCNVPWEPDRRTYGAHHQRSFWMRIHAAVALEALAAHRPMLVGELASQWGAPADAYALHDALVGHFIDRVEVSLDAPDLDAAAVTLRALGYRVARNANGDALDAEGDFSLRVRASRGGDVGLDLETLHAKMGVHYGARTVARFLPRG